MTPMVIAPRAMVSSGRLLTGRFAVISSLGCLVYRNLQTCREVSRIADHPIKRIEELLKVSSTIGRLPSTDRRRLAICLGVSSRMVYSNVSIYPSWTLPGLSTKDIILTHTYPV
jgi:hypothetical protein